MDVARGDEALVLVVGFGCALLTSTSSHGKKKFLFLHGEPITKKLLLPHHLLNVLVERELDPYTHKNSQDNNSSV